ncbi:transcription antitermination regulator [Rhizocola hellebori]|uniref:Transcription antitermination regulator n=1 Tax=Rhizocola hellebori TaxID=1392758 RepID=A0A8J3QD95_9ACTN|nr:SpoIIE family protein phosphatase [Rhizocola hellebori]GIH08551.1 transcription antitermination regulator [Rhizocola hellebori]
MSQDWPARVRRLEEEVAGLRRAMRARGLIEQAKGMLAERLGCDPEAAFQVLSAQSQHTNTPLTSVAADIVGVAPPAEPVYTAEPGHAGPEPVRLTDPMNAPQLRAVVEPGEWHGSLPRHQARGLRLTMAALDAAGNLDELVHALALTDLHEEKDTAAAIFVVEVDGGLRLLAAVGWPPQIVSAWRRVPPSINSTVGSAVRMGRPVVTDGAPPDDYVWIGPGTARMVFPLATDGRVVGALMFAWPDGRKLGELTRHCLSLAAVEAGRAASRLWPAFTADSAGSSIDLGWVRSILDGITGDAHLLLPLRDAQGRVADFVVEAASRSAAEGDPGMLGRRLLDSAPQLAVDGIFDAYVEVLANGVIWEGVHGGIKRRAIPVGGAVLASWEPADPDGADRLTRLEAMGGFGWAEWDLDGGETTWSVGMSRIFGRVNKAPVAFDALIKLVEESHTARMEAFQAELLAGRDSVVELRLTPACSSRWVRLFCEAPKSSGHSKLVQMLAQDVSERYAREERLRSVQSQAAAGRLRLASEQELTVRLAQTLYPRPRVEAGGPRARVLGQHWHPSSGPLLRADFCEAVQLPGGRIVAVIGDVFSTGTLAAATAVRLIRPVIALARAELSLKRILDVMNAELRQDRDPSLASLLVTVLEPSTGDFAWASAGHLPPILLRENTSRQLSGAAGPLLGLTETGYVQKRVRLQPGDTVVCYTDGLVDQAAEHPLAQLQEELSQTHREGGVEALLSAELPRPNVEACLLVAEFRG